MGEVYRARDIRLARAVAIKVLPASFATDADRLRRFEQEARATSALNHPNILTVPDFGMHEGAPYLVEELLEGEELRANTNVGYTLTGDGQRFLLVTSAEDTGVPPFTVVRNWMAEVKK